MADIEISFGTNAAQAAAQIDALGKSVAKVEPPAVKAKSALQQMGLALRGISGGRYLSSIVTQADKLNVAFLAAGAAVAVLRYAYGALSAYSERGVENAREQVKLEYQRVKAMREAQEIAGKAGLGFANAHEGTMRELIGNGRLDKADELTKQFGAEEAQKAVLLADKTFGSRADDALKVASEAAGVSGLSLTQAVDKAQYVNINDAAEGGRQMLSMSRNHAVSAEEYNTAQDRVSSSRYGQAFDTIDKDRGKVDIANEGRITTDAVRQSHEDLAAAISPLSKIQMDQYRVSQEQLAELKKAGEAQNSWIAWMEHHWSFNGNATDQYNQQAVNSNTAALQ